MVASDCLLGDNKHSAAAECGRSVHTGVPLPAGVGVSNFLALLGSEVQGILNAML